MKNMLRVPDCRDGVNLYACFRTTLPAGAGLTLWAADFYELFVNGERIAYGPVKSGEPLLYCDRYELPSESQPNQIAILVHGRKHIPELFAESSVGEPLWRCRMCRAYDRNAPCNVGDVGFSEFYDFEAREENWFSADFDDSGWTVAVSGREIEESHLLPRPIPPFREIERPPVKLRQEHGVWVADFGEMVYGRIRIRGCRSGAAPLKIEYIEDLTRGWAHTEGRTAMYYDLCHGERDRFEWKSFSKRGFRYVALSGNLTELEELAVEEYPYPVRPVGSFRCSDARLNRLWEISERTLRICMDDIFNDCPHRDQAQWMDAFVSSKAALSLFGVTDLTRKSIVQHALCSFHDGKLLSPSICGWSYMQDYAMVQILFIRWYCRVTGDRALLRELWPNCVAGVAYFEHYRQPDGLLADVRGAYLDNAFELCRLGKCAAVNALYFACLEAMGDLAELLGENPGSYRAESSRVRQAFHKTFRVPGGLRDATGRCEQKFWNFNFSRLFHDKYIGSGARAEFRISAEHARSVTLLSGAFGPYRVRLNGELVLENRLDADWARPLPAYEPDETALILSEGENILVFETACNFLNWDLFFHAEGVDFGAAHICEMDYETGAPTGGESVCSPRLWTPPAFSQTTFGYAAYAGLIGREELQNVLQDDYFRNYISVRVPQFCIETDDPEKLSYWIMPPNTPWTMFYFLSGLFENGLGAEAMRLLRKAWGVMLDGNAVNTWEEWGSNSSLCHAWGASPCWFFHREILGVKHETISAGFVTVRPVLFDLEWAEGTVSLGEAGTIRVALRRQGEQTLVSIVPETGLRVETDLSGLQNPVFPAIL